MNNSDEIEALFDQWNNALKTGDPKEAAALYATDAILLPTVSNKVRHNHEELKTILFTLAKIPTGKIDESNVRIFNDIAINSGVYTFTFADSTNVQARFTYVYKDDKRWFITEHHSSQMPE